MYIDVYARVCTFTSSMSTCLVACQSAYLPVCMVCVKASKKNWRQQEAKKCCQSVLAEQGADGSRGKTLGRPEPCTIQASFRWSATTGAKHHKVLQHTNLNTTHIYRKWGFYFGTVLSQPPKTQDCGNCISDWSNTTISNFTLLFLTKCNALKWN